MDWALILEYFKVLASWPPIVLIIFIILIATFHDPIGSWIKNLRVKYGDAEFSSQASRRDDKSEVEIKGAEVDQSAPADPNKAPRVDQEAALQWRSSDVVITL